MNASTSSHRQPPILLRTIAASSAHVGTVLGCWFLTGCYTSLGAGLGAGRSFDEFGHAFAGSISVGGAYDLGPARIGLGAVPLGDELRYGAELRSEICLRPLRRRDESAGQPVANCATGGARNTLNIRIHWLPGMYADNDPIGSPDRIGYDTGLFVALGYGLDGRSDSPSDDLHIIEYGNVGIGAFYSQGWFDTRSSDWSMGAYVDLSGRLDLAKMIGDAVSRKPH